MQNSAGNPAHSNVDKAIIPISVGTEIQIEIVEHNLRLKSELIGLEEGEFLIIKLAHSDPSGFLRSDIIRGCTIVVRYMYHSAIYGFQTTVQNLIHRPTRMIFVDYPIKIEEHNIRAEQRFDCVMQATGTSGEEATELIITDMSNKGCRCIIMTTLTDHKEELVDSMNMDTTLNLKIPFPASDDHIDISGTIRNINKDSNEIIFGVKFEDMTTEVKTRLDKLLKIIATISA